MSMKVTGSMTRLTAEAPMCTWMVLSTLASGEKTSNTDSVLRDGPMAPHTKANTSRERSTERASSHGLTIAPTLVISMITTSMGPESMSGLTAVFSQESGATTRWRVMEPSHGLMAESTSESMSTT